MRLDIFERFQDVRRIKHGVLLCDCGQWYPIINGVPRLLIGELRHLILRYHQDFVRMYSSKFPRLENLSIDKKQERTAYIHDSYMKAPPPEFRKWIDSQRSWIEPLTPEFYKEKIILDAGCRIGTRTYYAAKWGAKLVIGIDIGEAVEIAYDVNVENENVLILQADIYNMPFSNIFDYVYCMGVIHHLPKPQSGFNKLLEKIKPGGTILIWVYQFEGYKDRNFIVSMRKITTHLDIRVTRVISILYTCIYCLRLKFFYAKFWRRNNPNPFFEYLLPFRCTDYIEYLYNQLSPPIANYYKREELENWFKTDRIKKYQIFDTWNMGWKVIVTLR